MSGAGPNAEGTYIGDTGMRSPNHPFTATRVSLGEWTVSWLPGKTLTRNQATTAMVVADLLAKNGTDPMHLSHSNLLALGNWSSELGMLTSEMLAMFEAASRS